MSHDLRKTPLSWPPGVMLTSELLPRRTQALRFCRPARNPSSVRFVFVRLHHVLCAEIHPYPSAHILWSALGSGDVTKSPVSRPLALQEVLFPYLDVLWQPQSAGLLTNSSPSCSRARASPSDKVPAVDRTRRPRRSRGWFRGSAGWGKLLAGNTLRDRIPRGVAATCRSRVV
jgi:hypothetical protein